MANDTNTLETGTLRVDLDTTGQHVVYNAYKGKASSWRLQFVPGGASPGSAVLKQRLTGTTLSGSNYLTMIYYDDSTTTVPSAGTAITGAKIITVIADCCDLVFDYTSGVDGMTVYAKPMLG